MLNKEKARKEKLESEIILIIIIHVILFFSIYWLLNYFLNDYYLRHTDENYFLKIQQEKEEKHRKEMETQGQILSFLLLPILVPLTLGCAGKGNSQLCDVFKSDHEIKEKEKFVWKDLSETWVHDTMILIMLICSFFLIISLIINNHVALSRYKKMKSH